MKLIGNVVVVVLFIELCMAYSGDTVAILKQMQDWGKGIFLSIEKGSTKGQYLVAVVLEDGAPSPKDFTKYLLNGCPVEPNRHEKKIECRTSAVILNLESKEVYERSNWANKPEYINHPWHGEYRLLEDGIVKVLTNNFLSDRPNVPCKIYLYSFYIPCADIPGSPYSCADIIGKYDNDPTTRCKVASIGYTEVFKRNPKVKTNEQRSRFVLIDVYRELIHLKKEVKLQAIQVVQTESTFQELMFECVIDSKLSGCCVDYQPGGKNSQYIVSYFVNTMMYYLKQNKRIANSGIDINTKQELMGYIEYWLSRTIGGDCRVCSAEKKILQYLLGFCAQRALDLSGYFGTPKDRNDLSKPNWEKVENGKISNINMIDPSQFKIAKANMPKCALSSLSIDSLCTRFPKPSSRSREEPKELSFEAKIPRVD